MGQTYSVEARLKFKNDDPASFCKVIQDEIAARNGKTANFGLTRGNVDEPFGCFKILTTANAGQTEDGLWYADFDGSYGWESVLIQVFRAAARELADGSRILICPDNGCTEIAVKNGKVRTSYQD